MAQNTDVVLPEISYTRADYTALRAHCLKVPVDYIARLYYSEESPQLVLGLERFLLAMRADLIERAIGHNPAFGDILKGARLGGDITSKALQILIHAADVKPATPQRGEALSMWFRPRLATSLKGEGIASLDELMRLIDGRGNGWWRGIPRVGRLRARVIQAWFLKNRETLGALQTEAGREQIAASPLLLDPAYPDRLAPLERVIIPPVLGGDQGFNRSRQFPFIQAANDHQAIVSYLSRYQTRPHTLRAYRKELERFLLWSVMRAKKPMSSLSVNDCEVYKDFLVAPAAEFTGLRAPRISTRWKPFTGPVSPSSQRQAVLILRAAFQWLVAMRYLAGNPWLAVRETAKVVPASPKQIEKALPRELWDKLVDIVHARSLMPDNSQERIALAAILLLGDSGLRREEAAGALRSSLAPGPRGADMHELQVLGKRNTVREVPVSNRTVAALRAHWFDRGLDFDGAAGGSALIAPLVIPGHPAAQARHGAGQHPGYTADGLYRLLSATLKRLRSDGPDGAHLLTENDVERLSKATAHSLRHTFGAQAMACDMPLEVVQKVMGHASAHTTSIYMQGGKKRMRDEMEKYFARQHEEALTRPEAPRQLEVGKE